MQQIAKQLNEISGLTKRDAKWEKNAVKYILNNAIYAGTLESEIAGEKQIVTSANVQPIISETTHKLIRLRLQKETSGRKSTYARLPIISMTICIDCLKPVSVSTKNKSICCPSCLKELMLDHYLHSVNKSFIQFLMGHYTDTTVQKQLEGKKTNLFLQISILKGELNELKGRRKLIKEFFYDKRNYLDIMIKANDERKMELEEEISYRIGLLNFLFDKSDTRLEQVVMFNKEDFLYLQLPFLAIVDLESDRLYIKFHQDVLTSYEGH